MKKQKRAKKPGLLTKLMPVVLIVLLVAAAGTLLQRGSFASSPPAFHGFSASDRAKFNKAAQAYWSAHPHPQGGMDTSTLTLCPVNKVKIKYYHFTAKVQEDQLIARAKQGAGTETALNNFYFNCEIDFNRASVPSFTKRDICAVFVHEYGHLLDVVHSPDPNNVMFYAHTAGAVIDSGCTHYFTASQHY